MHPGAGTLDRNTASTSIARRALANLRERPALGIGVLLALAFALRIVGIGFGMPHVDARADEGYVLRITLEILRDRAPSGLGYPTAYMNVLAMLFAAYFALGRLTGRFGGVGDLAAEWAVDPSNFFVIARVTSAVFGALTVVAVYALGARLASKRTGFVAALLLAVSYLHVRDSHYATTDAALTLACTLCLFANERAIEHGTLRRFFVASALGGLAISTKYSAAPLVASLVAGCFLAAPSGSVTLPKRLGVSALGGVVGVLVGTPYVLTEPGILLRDFGTLADDKLGGFGGKPHAGIHVGRGWNGLFTTSLWYGVGWPMLLAAAAGLILFVATGRRKALPLVLFIVAYWAQMAPSLVVVARYALPLVPLVCFLAAVAVDRFSSLPAWKGLAAGMAAMVVVAWYPLVSSLRVDALLRTADSRLIAARWIERNVPSGTTLGLVGDRAGNPQLFSTMAQAARARERFRKRYRGEGVRLQRAIEHVDRTNRPAYVRLVTRDGNSEWVDAFVTGPPGEYAGVQPELVLVPDYPAFEDPYLRLGTGPWLWRSLEADYDLLFATRTWRSSELVFDRQDLFFLPLAGLAEIARPGPGYRVYVRKGSKLKSLPPLDVAHAS